MGGKPKLIRNVLREAVVPFCPRSLVWNANAMMHIEGALFLLKVILCQQ